MCNFLHTFFNYDKKELASFIELGDIWNEKDFKPSWPSIEFILQQILHFFLFLFFSDSLYDHLLDFVYHLSLLLPVSCISLPPLFLLFNVSSLIFTVFFPASSASLFDHLYLPPRPLNSTDTYPRPSHPFHISDTPMQKCKSLPQPLAVPLNPSCLFFFPPPIPLLCHDCIFEPRISLRLVPLG